MKTHILIILVFCLLVSYCGPFAFATEEARLKVADNRATFQREMKENAQLELEVNHLDEHHLGNVLPLTKPGRFLYYFEISGQNLEERIQSWKNGETIEFDELTGQGLLQWLTGFDRHLERLESGVEIDVIDVSLFKSYGIISYTAYGCYPEYDINTFSTKSTDEIMEVYHALSQLWISSACKDNLVPENIFEYPYSGAKIALTFTNGEYEEFAFNGKWLIDQENRYTIENAEQLWEVIPVLAEKYRKPPEPLPSPKNWEDYSRYLDEIMEIFEAPELGEPISIQ